MSIHRFAIFRDDFGVFGWWPLDDQSEDDLPAPHIRVLPHCTMRLFWLDEPDDDERDLIVDLLINEEFPGS